MSEPLVRITDLRKYFPIRKGFFKREVGNIKAVDGVSFAIDAGETLGLVGESGCGKTTLGRCVVRALTPTDGRVEFKANGDFSNITDMPGSELRPMRRHMQMIFQDPYSSLNPRMTVLDIVGEPLKVNNLATGSAVEDRVRELMRVVGLKPEQLKRYPHAFSGGQRQRIGIARALATSPKFIVADEAVSALDVSVQAQILNLLQDLQEEFDLTFLFVAHDLSVVEHISDRVAVMYVGKMVELGETEALYGKPLHPYTEALLSAVPSNDPDIRRERIVLSGEVANPAKVPSGCPFHPRCRYAESKCATDVPPLREVETGRYSACHFSEELDLRGVE
jgi:peptide/nickel transport system ATP-binding protein